MELYTDTQECKELTSKCSKSLLVCSVLIADEFDDLFASGFVTKCFRNSYYKHFCVCTDICWFTSMPVSFFVHLSAYFHFVVSISHVNIIMKYKMTENFGIAIL